MILQTAQSSTSSTGQEFTASDWLDGHFRAMQPEYEKMLRWVGIQSGWHVLDAACGGGSFLPLMTVLVGPQGSVSAIDLVAIKEYDITAQQVQPLPPTLQLHWHEAHLRAGDTNVHGLFRAIQLSQWLRAAGLVVAQRPRHGPQPIAKRVGAASRRPGWQRCERSPTVGQRFAIRPGRASRRRPYGCNARTRVGAAWRRTRWLRSKRRPCTNGQRLLAAGALLVASASS